eukprot:c24834_g2_i1 orf=407-973(+)
MGIEIHCSPRMAVFGGGCGCDIYAANRPVHLSERGFCKVFSLCVMPSSPPRLASLNSSFVRALCSLNGSNGGLSRRTQVSGMLGRNSLNGTNYYKNGLGFDFHEIRSISEEDEGKLVEVSLTTCLIGNKAVCTQCDSKGLGLCATCAGLGLYVDSILESQGIIVKVKCIGCGGSGSILCSGCGGKGHL